MTSKKIKKHLKDLDKKLNVAESKFHKKLSGFYQGLKKKNLKLVTPETKNLLKSKKIDKNDLVKMQSLIESYYLQVSAISIKYMNKEIKARAKKKVDQISVPDIDAGLRYRARVLAEKHLKEHRDLLIEQVKKAENKSNTDEAIALRKAIRASSKTFMYRHLLSTARTESIKAANHARINAAHRSRIVIGFNFLAILDKRTTQECRDRHDKYIPVHSAYLELYTPPIHWGCRSILSPVTIFEKIKFTDSRKVERVLPKNFGKKPDKRFAPPPVRKLSEAELYKRVRETERKMLLSSGNKYEMAAVFNDKGQVLLMKNGNKNSVGFFEHEVNRMKGNIVTHNHPNSSSFSSADMFMLSNSKAREIRAIAPDFAIKDQQSYTVFKASNFKTDLTPYKKELYKSDLKSIARLEYDKLEKIRNNIDNAFTEATHKTHLKLSKKYGYNYSYERKKQTKQSIKK